MFKSIIIKTISAYQQTASKIKPHSSCRYHPTCSQYTKEAIIKYDILKGVFLGVKRIVKCNPLFPGGKDPVTQ